MLAKAFKFIDSLLKSTNFAIFFMIFIGVISIYGTLFPPRTPFDFNLYKTPFFISLLFLFAINVGYCCYFRIIRVFVAIIKGKFTGKVFCSVKKDILENFKKRGFKIKQIEDGYLVSKGLVKTYSIVLLHIFIVLLIITAGLSSYLGFLGTVNIHEKNGTDICFSWNEKKDVLLPFNIYINSTRIDYYPMPLKLEIVNLKDNTKKEIITKEREVIDYNGLKIRILKGVIERKSVVFSVLYNGTEIGTFENDFLHENFSFKIKLLAYMDPLPRQFYADITIQDRMGNRDSKTININNPMEFQGYRIYLIDIGKDDFGFPYVGLQITYEPMLRMIWIICVLIILTLIIYPFVNEYHIKLKNEDNGFNIFVWKEILDPAVLDMIRTYEIK